MASPTLVSTTTTDFGTAGTTYGVVMPATVNAGDLLIAVVCIDNVQVWGTPPSGWERLVRNGFEDPAEFIAYKIADGSEDGTTVNFTSDQSRKGTAHVFRITGHRSVNPAFAGICGAYRPSGRVGAVQPFGTADILWITYASISSTNSILTGAAAPSGYSALTASGAAATDNAQLVSASKESTGVETEFQSSNWDTNAFDTRYGLIGIFASGTPDLPSDPSEILKPHLLNEYIGDFTSSDTTAHSTTISPRKGSYLIACVAMDSGNPTSITTPSGWTQVFHFDDTNLVSAIYTKRADGTETAVDFVTSNAQKGGVYIWEYQNTKSILGFANWTSTTPQRPPIIGFGKPDPLITYAHYVRFKDNGSFTWHGDMVAQATIGQSVASSGAMQVSSRKDPRAISESNPEFPGLNYEPPNSDGVFHFSFFIIPEWENATISGTVTLNGSPVQSAEIYAHDTRGDRIFGPALTDVNGDYALRVVDGYLYNVTIQYENGGQKYTANTAWAVDPIAD